MHLRFVLPALALSAAAMTAGNASAVTGAVASLVGTGPVERLDVYTGTVCGPVLDCGLGGVSTTSPTGPAGVPIAHCATIKNIGTATISASAKSNGATPDYVRIDCTFLDGHQKRGSVTASANGSTATNSGGLLFHTGGAERTCLSVYVKWSDGSDLRYASAECGDES